MKWLLAEAFIKCGAREEEVIYDQVQHPKISASSSIGMLVTVMERE
jgi:hypothetical protein